MSVHTLPAADALHRLQDFDAIIDARSESEYAHDHLPGAVNWPSLHDEERARVGTLHRQAGPFEARLVAAKGIATGRQRRKRHKDDTRGESPQGPVEF